MFRLSVVITSNARYRVMSNPVKMLRYDLMIAAKLKRV